MNHLRGTINIFNDRIAYLLAVAGMVLVSYSCGGEIKPVKVDEK